MFTFKKDRFFTLSDCIKFIFVFIFVLCFFMDESYLMRFTALIAFSSLITIYRLQVILKEVLKELENFKAKKNKKHKNL